ncbi:hypothetical protein [Roseateles depolymerans]|uniref:Uncharacterized protein n=1 Tax=Roseateles depolymerans TaxID=76731 RepID=A0A0U3N8K6_9BURK|nr:hypothetical protein [Roseateles depolymerans]ALV04880.1 hypothetical protein RD2015_377 [Roseateles depolymerans]REG15108.1 hypothetical protein DES44_3614 [Roseateles depolymerans]
MNSSCNFADAFAAASPGPVLSCNLFPLNGIGPLRVTYNWLYSAVNADPNDSSAFTWVINKVGSGGQVSLSPEAPFRGMTLYASVRPDYQYRVQVQAPFSADWITAVGSDEILTLIPQGFLIISLQGLNGCYLCADASQTSHDDHSGFLFSSASGSIAPAASFLVLATQVHQDLDIPLGRDLDKADLVACLSAQGVVNPEAFAQHALSSIG